MLHIMWNNTVSFEQVPPWCWESGTSNTRVLQRWLLQIKFSCTSKLHVFKGFSCNPGLPSTISIAVQEVVALLVMEAGPIGLGSMSGFFQDHWVLKTYHGGAASVRSPWFFFFIHTYIHTYMHTYIHTYIHEYMIIHTLHTWSYVHTYIHA